MNVKCSLVNVKSISQNVFDLVLTLYNFFRNILTRPFQSQGLDVPVVSTSPGHFSFQGEVGFVFVVFILPETMT